MLDPADWLEQAQQLPFGKRRQIQHICGGGKKLLIEHKAEGFSAWCYRCSDKGWHPHPQPSLAERIARLTAVRSAESAAEAQQAPPRPDEFNPSLWPLPARVWLYKAGFSNDSIQAHGFYYNTALERVVLPVFAEGRLVYWQARGFDPARPKYLNPHTDKPTPIYGQHGPLVLCEDILSAARVGAVARGLACLGTSLPDRAIIAALAAANSGPAYLWFDADDAGRKAVRQIGHALRLAGADVRVIRSPLDPKFYPDDILKEYIQSA